MKKCRRKFTECFCFKSMCSVAAGIAVTALLIAVFSLFMSSFDIDESVQNIAAAFAVCAGSFTAGFTLARIRRRNGFIAGLLCGAVIYSIVFFVSVFFFGFIASIGLFGRFIMILLFGAFGGVVGVNTKKFKH
ncbi:MAG: TIGR04086 family membrane protein [Oscillospiraceae bacterium]|nr:TIGR04086 family membrane protein [Oscillospiraceae bacterium]MDD6085546.1 TIGR04086 family membrane protein [Oscillospiraceae bacterium]MDY3256789.1 TIGR04086 family membrane protein [Ruminococcus callidus]